MSRSRKRRLCAKCGGPGPFPKYGKTCKPCWVQWRRDWIAKHKDEVLPCKKCGQPGKRWSDGKVRCNECMNIYKRKWSRTPTGKASKKRWRQSPTGKANQKRQYIRRMARVDKRIESRKAILRRYKMTPDDYKRMLEAQNGRCMICGIEQQHHLHVDHDHGTGLVRALLCRSCNNGLGGFKDSIEHLEAAIAYLKQHRSV